NEPSPQTTQPAAELPVPADNPYPALKDERSREAPSKRRQILVILLGLLALLVIGGMIYYFTTKEKPSREPAKVQIDDKRKEAVNRLASELLEYYKAKGTYPTLQEVNTPEFSKLPEGFNVDTYRDPSWNAQKSTCVTAQGKATLAEKRAGNCIAYRVTAPNGADCDAQQLKCTRAVLTATLEGDKPFIAALDRNKRE
ncbi:MAG TPA: hypothetical protein VFM05_13680, partial [Candidatus Saccharimonadales bacterium]|nr:hypothetical protein [Candidatus Saccharimonadales bacterium]